MERAAAASGRTSTAPVQAAVVDRRRRSSFGLALTVVLLVGASVLVTAPPAAAFDLGGGPPQPAGRVSPNGSVVNLAENGLLGWTVLNNGDGVFTDLLTAEVINPTNSERTVQVVVMQFDLTTVYHTQQVLQPDGNVTNVSVGVLTPTNQAWANVSFAIPPDGWTAANVPLPTAQSDHHLIVAIDGSDWFLDHHTLPAFIPAGTFSLGAVQLIVAGVIVIAGLITAVVLPMAKSIQRKGQRWAPRFRIGIWGPVGSIVGGLLFVNFYAPLDFALNEWVYVLIPLIYGVCLFFWSLRFFNSGDVREILKADPNKGLHLDWLRWERRFFETTDGDLGIVWETWRGWLYSFWKPMVIHRRDTDANVVEGPAHKGMLQYEETKRRPKGGADDFRIRNARDFEPGWLYWVDSDRPVDIKPPHLSMHREIEVPVLPPGATAETKPVTVKRRKLTWPYLTDPHVRLHLAGLHWEHVVMVALRHMTSEQLSRLLEITSLKVNVLQAELRTKAEVIAREEMDAFTRMVGRDRHELTDEEAREEVNAWGRQLDPYGMNAKERDRATRQ